MKEVAGDGRTYHQGQAKLGVRQTGANNAFSADWMGSQRLKGKDSVGSMRYLGSRPKRTRLDLLGKDTQEGRRKEGKRLNKRGGQGRQEDSPSLTSRSKGGGIGK